MLTTTRQARILDSVRADGQVTVGHLAGLFGVSASTIRRDLNALGAEGLLRRVRGGGSIEADSLPFVDVQQQQPQEKARIAARASEMVRDGDIVFLDIGTTVALLARALRGRRITVVTASLAAVDQLRNDPAVELIVLGGVVRGNYNSMVGALTEQALAQIRATVCFLGTSAIRADGTILDSTSMEVPIKRAMIESSARVVVLADATKLPGVGLLSVCGPEAVDAVVTDAERDAPIVKTLQAHNVEVVFA